MVNIGNISLEKGIILAPMAGVADLAFRELCMEFGAELCVSEMISAKAVGYNSKKTLELARMTEVSRPCAVQLFGHEPQSIAYAADRIYREFLPDAIDINMGCPAGKIVKNGDGCAVMKSPALVYELVKAARGALPAEIPVTAKLRAGFDSADVNAVECALMAEEAGASAVIIHGRTRDRFYKPPVDLEIIAEVGSKLTVPVIANGDIFCGEDALSAFAKTGCGGIMIGRGALGNPFIFTEIAAALEGVPYRRPSLTERLTVAKKHIEKIVQYKGERLAMLEARKHFCWYLKYFKGKAAYRAQANSLCTLRQLYELCDIILTEVEDAEY